MDTKQPKSKRIPPARSLGGELRVQLKKFFDGGEAHTSFDQAVADFPPSLRGVVPQALPYSAWQILEHIRVAQRDILEFSESEKYSALKWPDDYWLKNPEPPNDRAWDDCIRQIKEDRAAFEKLIDGMDNRNLAKPIPWGDGQNLLREAFLIGQHQSYHLGELIVIRRLLGAWKS